MKIVFSRSQKGFTLIEILASFVIFSILYASILKIYGVSLRSTLRAGTYNQAALMAQSHFAKLGQEFELSVGHSSGAFNQDFHWEMEVVPYDFVWQGQSIGVESTTTDLTNSIELLYVELRIFWDGGQHQALFETLYSITSKSTNNDF